MLTVSRLVSTEAQPLEGRLGDLLPLNPPWGSCCRRLLSDWDRGLTSGWGLGIESRGDLGLVFR